MPRKASGNFDQKAYIKQWKKQNQKSIKVSYRDQFVLQFKDACIKLGITQNSVFKKAMQDVIDQANNLE